MVFLRSNSTHKHKTMKKCHIHAKLHTDVKNVKHCSSVSFACSESNGAQEFVIALAHTCISKGENQKGVMKALNELFLLAKVLSSMSVHIFIIIIIFLNQYAMSDQPMVKKKKLFSIL